MTGAAVVAMASGAAAVRAVSAASDGRFARVAKHRDRSSRCVAVLKIAARRRKIA